MHGSVLQTNETSTDCFNRNDTSPPLRTPDALSDNAVAHRYTHGNTPPRVRLTASNEHGGGSETDWSNSQLYTHTHTHHLETVGDSTQIHILGIFSLYSDDKNKSRHTLDHDQLDE